MAACVRSCCPDPAWQLKQSFACGGYNTAHSVPVSSALLHTLVHDNLHTHTQRTQTVCKVKLVDQQHPIYLILFSIFPNPSLPAGACHLSALSLSSLPFLSLFHLCVNAPGPFLPYRFPLPPPFLVRLSSPDGSTPDLVA